MHLCDGGYGTKVLRVDPATGPAHAYSGTLCVFVDLAEPRPAAVTTCATTTSGYVYARCQRRTDQTDTTGPGTAESMVAAAEQQSAMAAFPSATAWDQAEVFTADVSAVAGTGAPVQWFEDSFAVSLTAAQPDPHGGVELPGVCFTIMLPGADAEGCVGRALLATGLAYGAFQDGDGPIEIIGIVPDEVTAVEIGGTTITPTNNVWHHTATHGEPLRITVRSADGRTVTTR